MNKEYWKAMGYPTLLALKDIAERHGVELRVVDNWKRRHPDFPKPIMTVSGGYIPLYLLEDVERYEERHGRRSGTTVENVPAKNGEPVKKVRDITTGRFLK